MGISVRTRFEVFKRDRFACAYCGRTPPEVLLEVDHILPIAAGGGDQMENLTTACWECNHGKAARLLDEGFAPAVSARVVGDAEERLAQATAYAEAMRATQELMGQFVGMVNEAWATGFQARTVETEDGTAWSFHRYGEQFPPEASIRRILRRLPVMEVIEAVEITASRFNRPYEDAVRYFFGVCWSKVTEREGKP